MIIDYDKGMIPMGTIAVSGKWYVVRFWKYPVGNDRVHASEKICLTDRISGLVFKNQGGRPLSQTNLVRRSLHPILEEIKVEKTGFHAMRRFRTTWLRKQRAPEDLIQYWLGHAEQSVTDGYSKLAEDVEFRGQVVETVGTGFVVPKAVRPMRPRKKKEEVAEVAA